MATRRAPAKASPPAPVSAPLANIVLLGLALVAGLGMLFARGRLAWPPTELLASLYTVAGCLAIVGPILLRRRDSAEFGLGELLWMAGGLMTWIFDAASMLRGDYRTLAWATPLDSRTMGLAMLAVLLAAWRCRVGGPSWSWTNVTGWTLGLFWVGMAATSLVPARFLGLAMR